MEIDRHVKKTVLICFSNLLLFYWFDFDYKHVNNFLSFCDASKILLCVFIFQMHHQLLIKLISVDFAFITYAHAKSYMYYWQKRKRTSHADSMLCLFVHKHKYRILIINHKNNRDLNALAIQNGKLPKLIMQKKSLNFNSKYQQTKLKIKMASTERTVHHCHAYLFFYYYFSRSKGKKYIGKQLNGNREWETEKNLGKLNYWICSGCLTLSLLSKWIINNNQTKDTQKRVRHPWQRGGGREEHTHIHRWLTTAENIKRNFCAKSIAAYPSICRRLQKYHCCRLYLFSITVRFIIIFFKSNAFCHRCFYRRLRYMQMGWWCYSSKEADYKIPLSHFPIQFFLPFMP